MSELKQLKQSRAIIKGQLSRMKNTLEAEVQIDLADARVRAAKLEELWKKLEDVQSTIEQKRLSAAVPQEGKTLEEVEEQLQAEADAEREIFEKIYFSAAGILQRAIHEAQEQVMRGALQQPNQEQQFQHERIDRISEVKLPTLKLPEFKGEYEEWLLFKDAFKSMIHENERLTPIQKFQYLRSAVTGEALQIISGLETSAENYQNAWELLINAYENSKLLINTHLNQLLNFAVITKDKATSVKKLIVHIRMHLKALGTLGLPVQHWDEILLHLIKSKLDFNTQKDWEEENNRDKTKRPTLEEFLTFLSERCRTLEIIDAGKGKQEYKKQQAPYKKQEKKIAMTATSQEGCLVCNEAHALYRCPKFLQFSILDRIKEVRTKRMCLNCLQRGHKAASCRSSTCKKCQGKHNTLLHLEQEAKQTKDSEPKEVTAVKNAVVTCCTEPGEQDDSIGASTSINFSRKSTVEVILSTAWVQVEDANGNRHNCRVLLDPGAQTNLITEDLTNRLKLKSKKSNQQIIFANNMQTNVTKAVTVKIKSIHTDYETTIECLVLSQITERLPQVRINSNLICVPKGLKLADPGFYKPGTIDILIGSGPFWKLLCDD